MLAELCLKWLEHQALRGPVSPRTYEREVSTQASVK